jgi:hypothetical protein
MEGGLEPVLGDGHVGVDGRDDFRVGLTDTGVAGGIGGLNGVFVVEDDLVVVVRADDVGGTIGGGVVDDVDVVVVGAVLREE